MVEDPGALREAIEETRAELGHTIEALGHKADVKSRASERLEDGKQQVRESIVKAEARVEPLMSSVLERLSSMLANASEKPAAAAAIAAAGAAVLLVVVTVSGRHRDAN